MTSQQPASAFAATIPVKELEGPQVSLLHDIFSILIATHEPPREIVGCGQNDAREAYARAKTEYVERIVAIALKAGYPRE